MVRRQDLAPRALSTPPIFQELTNDAEDQELMKKLGSGTTAWNRLPLQCLKAGDGPLSLITGFLCAGSASLQALVQRHVVGPDSLKFSSSRVASEFMYA